MLKSISVGVTLCKLLKILLSLWIILHNIFSNPFIISTRRRQIFINITSVASLAILSTSSLRWRYRLLIIMLEIMWLTSLVESLVWMRRLVVAKVRLIRLLIFREWILIPSSWDVQLLLILSPVWESSWNRRLHFTWSLYWVLLIRLNVLALRESTLIWRLLIVSGLLKAIWSEKNLIIALISSIMRNISPCLILKDRRLSCSSHWELCIIICSAKNISLPFWRRRIVAGNWAVDHTLSNFVINATSLLVFTWNISLTRWVSTSSLIGRLSDRLLAIEILTSTSVITHVKIVLNTWWPLTLSPSHTLLIIFLFILLVIVVMILSWRVVNGRLIGRVNFSYFLKWRTSSSQGSTCRLTRCMDGFWLIPIRLRSLRSSGRGWLVAKHRFLSVPSWWIIPITSLLLLLENPLSCIDLVLDSRLNIFIPLR